MTLLSGTNVLSLADVLRVAIDESDLETTEKGLTDT